jgi:DNA-binding transcriptional ArsR family regulator
MTQVTKHSAMTPKQASRTRSSIDKALDPDLFKALSDPTRVKLLACLAKCGRGCSVTEVAQCCSVDFSVVSRHLALLADARVLDASKVGRTMYYTVRYEHLTQSLRALADAIDGCCSSGACCDSNGAGAGKCC